MDLKETTIEGIDLENHWYYVTKWHAIRKLLPQRKFRKLWDIGGGSGYFSRRILEADMADQAASIDTGYKAPEQQTVVAGKPLEFLTAMPEGQADLMLFMDVLEHVDDDVGMLRSYGEKLEDGGTILITVPAFEFLWSGHDDFLEHKRRYTRAMLWATIEKAGFEPVRTRFAYSVLFPVIAAVRIVGKLLNKAGAREPRSSMKQHGKFMNWLLKTIHDFERALFLPWNRWVGLTIICEVRRP